MIKEYRTPSAEVELHNKLAAKIKMNQRKEKEFYKIADNNKDDLLERWGIPNLPNLCELYETDLETLISHLTSEKQVNYFKSHHKNKDTNLG